MTKTEYKSTFGTIRAHNNKHRDINHRVWSFVPDCRDVFGWTYGAYCFIDFDGCYNFTRGKY